MNNEEEIELIDYFKVIWRRRRMIIGGTLACVLAVLTMSLLLPKTYETDLYIQIGQVWEKSLEDTYRVAEIINSESFLDKVREKTHLPMTTYRMKKEKIVIAKTIDAGKKLVVAVPQLVEIVTRANTPEKAVELAETAAELVIQEHKPRFDELMYEYNHYENGLANQIQAIQNEVRELEILLKRQRTNPQVNAPAVILLQAQLEQKQSQLLGYMREIRDVKLNNVSKARSENTRVLLRPVLPEKPVSLNIVLNILVTGIIGMIVFLILAFFLEYLAQVKQSERATKDAGQKPAVRS